MPDHVYIGLMSGTSCDGIEAALVRLKGSGPSTAMKLVDHQSFPYPDRLRTRLLMELFIKPLAEQVTPRPQRVAEARVRRQWGQQKS